MSRRCSAGTFCACLERLKRGGALEFTAIALPPEILTLAARGVRIKSTTMANDVQQLRDLARAFWTGQPIPCPKHHGAMMTGSFAQTTFAAHIVLTCQRGREAITIPQR